LQNIQENLNHNDEQHEQQQPRITQKRDLKREEKLEEHHAVALRKIEEKLKMLSIEMTQHHSHHHHHHQNPNNIKANLISSTSSSSIGGIAGATSTLITSSSQINNINTTDKEAKKRDDIELEEEFSTKISCVTGQTQQTNSTCSPDSILLTKTTNNVPLTSLSNAPSNSILKPPPSPPPQQLENNPSDTSNTNKKKFFHLLNKKPSQSQHLNLKKISNTKVNNNYGASMKKVCQPVKVSSPTTKATNPIAAATKKSSMLMTSTKNYVNRSTSINDSDNKLIMSELICHFVFILTKKNSSF
jgi:hypothetical protein